MPPTSGVKGAQAFGKAIAVLNLVADAPRAPRFIDLMAQAGLPKGTLHRIVSALIDQRLVRLNARDQTYRLGPRLFELAHRVWANFDLRDAAASELERIAELWRGTAHLAIPDGNEALIIDLAEGPQPFRLPFGVGRRLPLHATALGKAILAFMAPEQRAEALARIKLDAITPRTIVERARLDLDLDLAVVRGYAIDDEELETGIRCIAAPILDHTGAPIGAISVSQPVFRVRLDELHVAARDVMDAARQIAGNAGATSAFSISTPPRPAGKVPAELACVQAAAGLNVESPLWNAATGSLQWVDLLDPHLGGLKPGQEPRPPLPLGDLVSCIALRASGGLVAATRHGLAALDPATGRLASLVGIESDRPRNRPNDGRCDRAGRLWVGTMAMDAAPGQGALYRVEADRKVVRVDGGFGVSNGIAWSPDDRWMYFVDSRARTIYRYRFDLVAGSAEGREVFVDLTGQGSGNPAGIAVDAEGFVWSAIWDGWSVTRFAPNGRVDRVVRLPVPRPTSCTFGGRRLSTLYITTSRSRLSRERLNEAPLSGSIFALPLAVRGQAETPFAG
jgi:sugar lactone lactonase YvrE/DNA-binding IclR family transcriptional regulator